MHQFVEKIPELKGFSAFYDEEILPQLLVTETRRKARVKAVVLGGLAIAALTIVLSLHLRQRFGGENYELFSMALGASGIFAFTAFVLKSVKAETKNILIKNICDFIGWSFSETVHEAPPLGLLCENDLLPRHYHRVNFEDKMTGQVHGASFEALECHMEKKVQTKDGSKWQTVFRGAIMAIDFNRKFSGKTVVLRDMKIFNKKKRGDMKRVGLVDPVFEKIFEAYGTDQVEARYLLTPDFMQQLVDLETSVDGKKIRFGFLNDLLLIVVETSNRFEAGNMFKSLTDTSRTQKILDEVAAVYGVVDGLMKPQSVPDSFKI